jgi:hypothetical protein
MSTAATLGRTLPTRATERPEPGLRCRITWRDGRRFAGELPPERHRMIQLGMLHRQTKQLVELTPGTRDLDGRFT